MRIRSLFVALVAVAVLAGCQDDDSFTLSKTIEARTFSIDTPDGWSLAEGVGYDSYVGEFRGPLGVIHFDQGFFAFPGLDNITSNERTIYLKHVTINGFPAIILKEKTRDDSGSRGQIQLSVFVEGANPGQRNHLYLFDPNAISEPVALAVMKTHRFR